MLKKETMLGQRNWTQLKKILMVKGLTLNNECQKRPNERWNHIILHLTNKMTCMVEMIFLSMSVIDREMTASPVMPQDRVQGVLHALIIIHPGTSHPVFNSSNLGSNTFSNNSITSSSNLIHHNIHITSNRWLDPHNSGIFLKDHCQLPIIPSLIQVG